MSGSNLSEDEEFELLSLEREKAQGAPPAASPQTIPEAVKAAFQQTTAPIVSAAKALQPKNLTGLLPTAGMLAGTAIAPGPGTAAGAGLGSIAQRMADLAYGQGAPPPTPGANFAPKEAIMPMANAALAGIPETSEGQYLGEKAGSALSYLKNRFAKALPKVGQAATGKSAVKVARLMKDPTAVLPESLGGAKSIEDATAQYGQTLENAPIHHPEGYVTRGLDKKEFNPFVQNDSEAADLGKALYDKWKAGETLTAQEAFNAKRATDYTWPKVVSERNKEKIRTLAEFKNAMDEVLSSQSGHFLKASKDYARSLLGADFTQILPRTKTGDISSVKSLILPLLEPKKIPFLLATSPAMTGAVNLAAQGGMKGLNAIAQNPEARQVLLQVLQKLMQGNQAEQPQP